MRISNKDNKFESAMGGAYTMKGNKTYPKIEWASFPISKEENLEVTHRLDGGKMYITGVWTDIFIVIKAKQN